MRTTTILTACCILLLPLYAPAAHHEAPLVQQVEKPANIRPVKAKPAKKPKTTSSKDKLSVTGYGEDPGEETQERPNPLNRQGIESPKPVTSPVR